MIKQLTETRLSDEIKIHRLLNEAIASVNNADVDRLLELHTDDVILMEPNLPLIRGKKRVRQLFADFAKQQVKLHLTYDIRELQIENTLAYVRGTIQKSSKKPGENPVYENCKFISLFRKQENGQWLRTHVIVNSDLPVT